MPEASIGAAPGTYHHAVTEDEWRVEIGLDDEAHGFGLGERFRAHDLDDEARKRLGHRIVVTRDGPHVFLYAGDEAGANQAEMVARELVASDDLSADITVTRWHPLEEEWLDASIPLPRTDEEEEKDPKKPNDKPAKQQTQRIGGEREIDPDMLRVLKEKVQNRTMSVGQDGEQPGERGSRPDGRQPGDPRSRKGKDW